MQFIDNDMDDLFREAAKDYPLRRDGADWDKVAQHLSGSEHKGGASGERKRTFFGLLLLIPLLIICTTYINRSAPEERQTSNPGEQSSGPALSSGVEPTLKNNSVRSPERRNEVVVSRQERKTAFPKKAPVVKQPLQSYVFTGTKTRKEADPLKTVPERNEEVQQSSDPSAIPSPAEEQPAAPPEAVAQTPEAQKEPDPLEEKPAPAKKSKPKKEVYGGVLLGVDATTVKGQRIRSAGYTAGLLAGVQLSRRLAVESGVYWNRKKYYSTGEYFKTGKINLPQHAEITWVDGYCDMFEIPVTVKFDWAVKGQHRWFATAGLSSYLMKKEAYDYEYTRYNQQYEYYKVYRNETKNWFSVVNLSIGYQKKLGALGHLRLEPYVGLPVKGLGIGRMPLTSAGMRLGLTRTIR